jgi:hypothetical protein
MPDARDFRDWAARIADQAGKERDLDEADRLASIAKYWNRLADLEDWERDARGGATRHRRSRRAQPRLARRPA